MKVDEPDEGDSTDGKCLRFKAASPHTQGLGE